ncbi:unnamed protein product [Fraxinus pennsylvanica]|uniref:SUI1 domain-containing protein n=1 Tax=Fraxinus pennsylvanica TaxID=56036 RepID=A0AAD2DNF9_9LAMI|nr:unnamed protein product [Fraxinus pennsylvanica]
MGFVDPFDTSEPGPKKYVYIIKQERNGKECLTLVLDLWKRNISEKLVLKEFKKEWSCNGKVAWNKTYGWVVQIEGDHRNNMYNFLGKSGILSRDNVIVG